jgi:hypothetical protein
MERGWRWMGRIGAAGCVFFAVALPLGAQPGGNSSPGMVWTALAPPPGLVPPCDQFDTLGPAASARITLDSRDLVRRGGTELRSFIETGSLGEVEVAVAGASPPGAVFQVSATPELSRISRDFGERLKGVALDVALVSPIEPVRVVLDLRQVCARHFRSTFLHY